MGAFVANIHLHLPAADAGSLEIAEALLLRHAQSSVYEPASDGRRADRTTWMIESSKDWVIVFDEDAETQDERWLEELAAALSMEPVSAAISIVVSDSDEGTLSLFRHGSRVGRIRLRPGKPVRFPPAWRSLFPQLPASLEAPQAFAEEPIERVADLLGWNLDFVLASLSDRPHLPEAPDIEVAFSLRPEHQFLSFEEGAPELETEPRQRSTEAVGQPFHALGATISNRGGAFSGLRVVIPVGDWSEFLAFERIRLTVGAGRTTYTQDLRTGDLDGKAVLVADLPEFELGAYPSWSEWKDEPWRIRKAQAALDGALVWMSIEGTATKTGSTNFRLLLLPVDHPSEGVVVEYEVTIGERFPWQSSDGDGPVR